MSEATDDPTARAIYDLTNQLRHAKADAGRAEGHLDAVQRVLMQYLWDARERARRGEQIPASEVAKWLSRLWDAATIGRKLDSARNTGEG